MNGQVAAKSKNYIFRSKSNMFKARTSFRIASSQNAVRRHAAMSAANKRGVAQVRPNFEALSLEKPVGYSVTMCNSTDGSEAGLADLSQTR